jgi:hypothetical protein
MPEFLKGNYKLAAAIEDKAAAADSTDEFEKKALSRLGGSICFVSKKSLMWQGEAQPQASRADTEDGSAKALQNATAVAEEKSGPAKARHEASARAEKADGAGKKDSPRA